MQKKLNNNKNSFQRKKKQKKKKLKQKEIIDYINSCNCIKFIIIRSTYKKTVFLLFCCY